METLDPDSITAALRTRCFGRHPVCLPTTGSTNDVARDMAANGAPEGTLVLAETQTAGRGRLARRWLAAPGTCLLMSLLLRPPIPPAAAFGLTILAGIATARAVQRLSGLPCRLKWPNDVQVNGRKLAGILCEMSASDDRLDWAVLGIGLNVNLDPAAYPEIAATATSLSHALGRPLPRLPLLAALLEELEADYGRFLAEGLAPLRAEWRDKLVTLGQQVSFEGGLYEGRAEDVDEDGALLLRRAGGELVRITVGDAVPLRDPGHTGPIEI